MAQASGRILVVDDNAVNLTLLTRALGKSGYGTIKAETGEDGERLARAHQPDLILLDIELPGIDGFEVCKILKSDPETAGIPIIFLTARSDSGDVETAFSLGGCDYVTKPFRISEVKARVSVHLELKRAQNELIEQNKRLEDLSSLVAETNMELAKIARQDSLTDVLNRGAWEEAITAEQARSSRSGAPYSVLMLDIDHFKLLNDALGHQHGDECLKKFCRCLRATCRGIEVVGRYGGEEFVILAPNTTEAQALELGERLCRAIVDAGLVHPASPTANCVTASIGIAESCPEGWEETLRRADVALYKAKSTGRNRVCVDSDSSSDDGFQHASNNQTDILASSRDGEGHTVLAIDDDADARLLYRHTLEQQGFTVLETNSAVEGLSLAERAQPDAILLDLVMPGLDGLSAIGRLRSQERTKDIPIVVISARVDALAMQECLAAGADDFILKPLRFQELVNRIRFMLWSKNIEHCLAESNATRGEQARVLGLLLELTRSLGSCDVLEDALRQTVDVAAELTSCSRVSIMLPDAQSKTLIVAQSVGLDQEVIPTEGIPIGESIAGRVYLTGAARVINSSDEEFPTPNRYETPFFASVPLVYTPIGVGADILGVFNFSERLDHRPFSDAELGYIDLITQITGTSIHAIQSREARDEARDSILAAFALLAERRDSDTGRHVERVTEYALVLAEDLRMQGYFEEQLSDEFLQDMRRATPIHDIGKVAIPDRILLKPGPLTAEERAIMETHTTIGRDTIRSVRKRVPTVRMLEVAEDIAYSHHEWFNGEGYPSKLKRHEIPLAARIVAIADVYDAVTTERPYKKAMSHETAEGIIRDASGKQFDPVIVEAFLRHVEDFKRLAITLADNFRESEGANQPLLVDF